MTIKTRRFLSIFFIFLFCVLTPLIILYASGYELNLNYRILEKTGTIIIKTTPKNANISLSKINYKEAASTQNYLSPTRIEWLKPGEYNISIQFKNYYSYIKQVAVKANSAVYLDNVYLIKQTSPQIINDLELRDKIKSSFNSLASSTKIYNKLKIENTGQEIKSISQENNQAHTILRIADGEIKFFEKHPTMPYIFYYDGASIKAVEISVEENQNIYTIFNGQIDGFNLSENEKNLYYIQNNQLYAIEIAE